MDRHDNIEMLRVLLLANPKTDQVRRLAMSWGLYYNDPAPWLVGLFDNEVLRSMPVLEELLVKFDLQEVFTSGIKTKSRTHVLLRDLSKKEKKR